MVSPLNTLGFTLLFFREAASGPKRQSLPKELLSRGLCWSGLLTPPLYPWCEVFFLNKMTINRVINPPMICPAKH